MNKIKMLYDVVTTMKEKELLRGDVKVVGQRDEIRILDFRTQFERNQETGQVKTRIQTEVNCEGNQIKHESSTEFTLDKCPRHFHGMRKYIYCQHLAGEGHAGIKDKLDTLAFILHLLNKLQVEEKAGFTELSLDLTEFSEHLQKDSTDHIPDKIVLHQHDQHGLIQQLLVIENPEVKLTARINQNHEIEQFIFVLTGQQKDESGESHAIVVRAEANLNC